MSRVRTRFAPSPTGFLHLGSARTALFNWAFARHCGGDLILRIEDTDRERSSAESEAAICEGLRWLGIEWDEGPFRQSERAARHAATIAKLIESGRAYRCRCTPAELEERKRQAIAAGSKWTYDGRCRNLDLDEACGPHTVRLRISDGAKLAWDDAVFGPSGQDAREIGDMIIRRSDGHPLYHLAVVVDDLDMGITHVIRGADHHANTPFQIAIYQALERDPPLFAHVPMLVGKGGKKLSKRREPVSLQAYRNEGFLPQATCNWLARLGWSHGDREIFSLDEIRALFDLDAVHRSSAQADTGKLLWLNQHYIKELPRDELLRQLHPFLEREAGRPIEVTPALTKLVDLLRERGKTLLEMARQARFFVCEDIAYDEKDARKYLNAASRSALRDLHAGLSDLDAWEEGGIQTVFDRVRAAHGDLAMGKLAQPVRVAVTGRAVSPGIFETLAVLGKRRTLIRLGEALERLARAAAAGAD